MLRGVLDIAAISSCSCYTKTNDYKFHDDLCLYRIIEEARVTTSKLVEGYEKANDLAEG